MNQTLLTCPCQSGVDYSNCCAPFHQGEKLPSTARELMRSRFAAYALNLAPYLHNTWETTTRPKLEKLNLAQQSITWTNLEIISTQKGGPQDSKGLVEFKAFYEQNGTSQVLHETSRFVKKQNRWFYLDGMMKPTGQTIKPQNEGKNAPCPCGSGKKFKRCCGAA